MGEPSSTPASSPPKVPFWSTSFGHVLKTMLGAIAGSLLALVPTVVCSAIPNALGQTVCRAVAIEASRQLQPVLVPAAPASSAWPDCDGGAFDDVVVDGHRQLRCH